MPDPLLGAPGGSGAEYGSGGDGFPLAGGSVAGSGLGVLNGNETLAGTSGALAQTSAVTNAGSGRPPGTSLLSVVNPVLVLPATDSAVGLNLAVAAVADAPKLDDPRVKPAPRPNDVVDEHPASDSRSTIKGNSVQLPGGGYNVDTTRPVVTGGVLVITPARRPLSGGAVQQSGTLCSDGNWPGSLGTGSFAPNFHLVWDASLGLYVVNEVFLDANGDILRRHDGEPIELKMGELKILPPLPAPDASPQVFEFVFQGHGWVEGIPRTYPPIVRGTFSRE